MIVALVLGGLLLVVLASNMLQFAQALGGGAGPDRRGRFIQEVTVEDQRSQNKIAVVDVEGLITSQAWDSSGRSMVQMISDRLKAAKRDSAVKGVILKVDSPGGEVMASDQISRAILEFQEEAGKPVVALLGGLAASGGYYVAAPAQWIVANELTITGSIGVILQSFNYRGLLDKVGLHPQVFKSGRFKDMLGGSRKPEDIDPREVEMIQSMIDETYERFKEVVRTGRARAGKLNRGKGQTLAEDWEQYADGRILTGRQAYDYGFVDEKGDLQTAFARARALANIADADLIRYEEPFDLSRLFGFFAKSGDATLKVDLGLEFPKLQAGRLYFLSATVLH